MDEPEWASTWEDHTSAFDRVRSVVMAVPEPQSASWIADRAHVAESTAREHLDRLAEMGAVAIDADEDCRRYGPDPAYLRFREIRTLTDEHDRSELGDLVVDLKESIADTAERYDAETPAELRAAAAEADVTPEETRTMHRAAADWEHYSYRLSLLDDAITHYDAYTKSATPA